MYTQIWNKYLPIIRILMKRTASSEQLLKMNVIDFERAGAGRKAGYKFTIKFRNGRVDNVISTSPMAKDLASALLEDETTKDLLQQNEYTISLNSKYQLSIKRIPTAEDEETEAVPEKEATVEESN